MSTRGLRRPVACFVAGAAIAGFTGGCFGGGGNPPHKKSPTPAPGPSAAVPATAHRLARLRRKLPAGFVAPGSAPVASRHERLKVAPAVGLRPSDVRLAPLPPRQLLRRILAVTVNLPVPLVAQPIYLSAQTVRGGDRLKVAAARLSPVPHHVALFVLQGPSYRADHLVAVGNGVAAGYLTLPSHMAAGQWYVVAEDLSTLRKGVTRGFTGHALVDVGVLTVH